MKLEGIVGLLSALVAIVGLGLLGPGSERDEEGFPRRGWIFGLILIGLAFFWFGVAGVLD